MSVVYDDRTETRRVSVPVKVVCDACGNDATGRRFGDGVTASYFVLCRKNAADNPVSETAMINETVPTHEANLCEPCADAIAAFINTRAHSYAAAGMRPTR